MEQNQEQNIAEIKIRIIDSNKEFCKICGHSSLKNDLNNCDFCLGMEEEYSLKKLFRSNFGALVSAFIIPSFGIDISQTICLVFGLATLLEFIV